MWHKLYASTQRQAEPAKARKDLLQAATLSAVLVETDAGALEEAAREAPRQVLQAARSRLTALAQLLQAHPETLEELRRCLA